MHLHAAKSRLFNLSKMKYLSAPLIIVILKINLIDNSPHSQFFSSSRPPEQKKWSRKKLTNVNIKRYLSRTTTSIQREKANRLNNYYDDDADAWRENQQQQMYLIIANFVERPHTIQIDNFCYFINVMKSS